MGGTWTFRFRAKISGIKVIAAMTCQQFFEENKDDPQRCKKLQLVDAKKQIDWESETASKYSPNPVENDEVLCRQVLDPTHYDKVKGTIAPTFFDDASSKGASCHRLSLTTPEKIEELTFARVSEQNKNPPNTGLRVAIGYAEISASEVRGDFLGAEPPRRGADAYDNDKSDDVSHADICQLASGKHEGRSVRAQLFMIAKDRLVKFKNSSDQNNNQIPVNHGANTA